MPASPQTLLLIVTALGVWTGVGVTALIFLSNKLDKRFDELREDMKEGFAQS